mmetsp:Transcript_8263/g.8251  ORF Transcript_8263/g.8251 Transcript_8263/m.8251 type:complete len:239 (-) Transcript_8263:330-1046(-)
MLIYLFLVVCFTAFLSTEELTSLMKKSLISTHTKILLRRLSFYSYNYFLFAAILSLCLVSFIWNRLPSLDIVGYFASLWGMFSKFIVRLENNEYTYQCQFGLSLKAVKCEIYGNANRLFFLVSYQSLKYAQEIFSYNDFNLFRVSMFIHFVYTTVGQLMRMIRPYKSLSLIINNSILLVYCAVHGMYCLYNWREVARAAINEEDDEVEEISGDKCVYEQNNGVQNNSVHRLAISSSLY